MKHFHGTYYIARTFPNNNKVLYTGCLAGTFHVNTYLYLLLLRIYIKYKCTLVDVMEEWDLEKAEKICEYEVPTGPASNYRMDETYCLIERENSLKRWKRHKDAEAYGTEHFDWIFENP